MRAPSGTKAAIGDDGSIASPLHRCIGQAGWLLSRELASLKSEQGYALIMSDKPTIFISYSRDDHKAKDFVVSHLKLLEEHSELRFWHDQDMAGGDAWETEID